MNLFDEFQKICDEKVFANDFELAFIESLPTEWSDAIYNLRPGNTINFYHKDGDHILKLVFPYEQEGERETQRERKGEYSWKVCRLRLRRSS